MVPIGAAHAGVLATLHAASFSPTEAWSEAAFAGLLASPGVSGLVSEQGGFILWRQAADDADIVTIAVVPEARQRGLGGALLAEAVQLLAARGVLRLFLEVAEANAPALALYARAGFVTVGQRRGYYQDGTTALLMRRDIAP